MKCTYWTFVRALCSACTCVFVQLHCVLLFLCGNRIKLPAYAPHFYCNCHYLISAAWFLNADMGKGCISSDVGFILGIFPGEYSMHLLYLSPTFLKETDQQLFEYSALWTAIAYARFFTQIATLYLHFLLLRDCILWLHCPVGNTQLWSGDAHGRLLQDLSLLLSKKWAPSAEAVHGIQAEEAFYSDNALVAT